MSGHVYACARWVRPSKFAELTGMTQDQIKQRRLKGEWPEGRIWIVAPDGQIRINVEEYDKWAESCLT